MLAVPHADLTKQTASTSSTLIADQCSRKLLLLLLLGMLTPPPKLTHQPNTNSLPTVSVCAQSAGSQPWSSYLGRFPERIFQAYSLRNFWKMVVRAIMGSPVLSWEHCIMHFL